MPWRYAASSRAGARSPPTDTRPWSSANSGSGKRAMIHLKSESLNSKSETNPTKAGNGTSADLELPRISYFEIRVFLQTGRLLLLFGLLRLLSRLVAALFLLRLAQDHPAVVAAFLVGHDVPAEAALVGEIVEGLLQKHVLRLVSQARVQRHAGGSVDLETHLVVAFSFQVVEDDAGHLFLVVQLLELDLLEPLARGLGSGRVLGCC